MVNKHCGLCNENLLDVINVHKPIQLLNQLFIMHFIMYSQITINYKCTIYK